MTIENFINECNKLIRTSHIAPSVDTCDVRHQGVNIIKNHFKTKNIEVKSITYNDTEICLEHHEKITLPDIPDKIEVFITISFKICTKKTGNIISVSKLRNKYEYTASDNFVKFDSVEIDCRIPTFKLVNQKLVKTGKLRSEKAILEQKISTTWSINDIIQNIDTKNIKNVYDMILIQPVIQHKIMTNDKNFLNQYTLSGNVLNTTKLIDYIKENLI